MNKQLLITQPVTFDAVLEPGLISGDGLQSVRVLHPDGELAAWTWQHFDAANTDSVLTATVTIRPFGYPLGLTSVIDRIQWQPTLQVVDLIPEVSGTAKLVARFRSLLVHIRHPGLQQLLQDVFALRPLFYDYWNTSLDMDGRECSLAEKAISNAELVQWSVGLSSFQRCIGMTFALLRNAGQAWPREEWSDGEHALHLLRQIDGSMSHLASVYPEDADVLRELMEHEYRLSLSPLALSTLEHVNYLADTSRLDAHWKGPEEDNGSSNLISLDAFRRRRASIST
ncbi:hypothetical protein IAE60_02960 [Pseudoxanthomonas mexicana]|uniref:Uncharacterized protein n=1 Tax=Pseudoxanthomonas mexicana TaxID=128785 RepID=A0A7G9TE89_PSEMX|nr:hypothetical protein [Pseudoxanthomonas mexicana]QNN78414.1 hypothetical protein IAE60_02960 [Pseudoxanthomonas mexicana]